MLGVRLSDKLDRRIAAFASRRGQAKSEIARKAIVEFLDRHELDDDFEHQLRLLAVPPLDISDLEAGAFGDPEWR